MKKFVVVCLSLMAFGACAADAPKAAVVETKKPVVVAPVKKAVVKKAVVKKAVVAPKTVEVKKVAEKK